MHARARRAAAAARASHRRSPLVAALISLGRRLGAPAPTGGLARRIEAAGSPLGLGPGDVMALKLAAALTAFAVVLPWSAALPGRLPVVALIASAPLGFLAPDAALRRRARRRGGAMETELGDVLDLLRVAVAAGLGVERALAEVGSRHPGGLAAELRRTAAEIGLGVDREAALAALARRAPAAGVPELVAALRRAARTGAPLAGTLAAQALEARGAHARRIADRAARAAPRMQLVIALVLVPSVFLLVAAALLPGALATA